MNDFTNCSNMCDSTNNQTNLIRCFHASSNNMETMNLNKAKIKVRNKGNEGRGSKYI
jgi:hypothetical protein